MLTKVVRNYVCIQLRNCSSLSPSVSKIEDLYPSPDNKCETNILKVAIIGLPNAGKSTFINNLMDRRVNIYTFLQQRYKLMHFILRYVHHHKKCIQLETKRLLYLLKAIPKLCLLIHQDLWMIKNRKGLYTHFVPLKGTKN